MLKFYAFQLWEWLVVHGIPLSALIIIAILIPRLGRLAIRIVSSRFDEGEEATKSRLALVGALVYVLQAIAYFAIIMLGLTNLGVPAMGAALPATVVSAAIGFGAQNVIGDFLAGFFIISERQFGVGDFVAFDGTSSNISGTVVGLTLRATKVRTASGEVVTIPNGSAGVITNYSQDWSRAVVDLAVPLQPGESMSKLTQRVETTAGRALEDESIADDVTGELEVLPATDIVAPTAAGQPWQVNFRVMVVVNPARQWAVERVLRSALVNVFWDRYDMPRAFLGGAETPSTDPRKAVAAEHARAPTEVLPTQHSHAAASDAAKAEQGSTQSTVDNPLHPASKDDGPGVKPLDSDGTVGRTRGAHAGQVTSDGTVADTAAKGSTHDADIAAESIEDKTGDEESAEFEGIWRNAEYKSKFKKLMSIGGRTRPSTTGLILALLLVGGLALASSNPEGGDTGWLSPDYWRDRQPKSESTVDPKANETSDSDATGESATADNATESNATDGNVADSSVTDRNVTDGNANENNSEAGGNSQSVDGGSSGSTAETSAGNPNRQNGQARTSAPANGGQSATQNPNAQNEPNATDTARG